MGETRPVSKERFMAVLENNNFKPFNEDGVIMIMTDAKSDLNLVEQLADKIGFTGSYGWRLRSKKAAATKTIVKEPIYTEEEKKEELRKAKEQDLFNLDFLEAIQNADWYDDNKKVLKEYSRFLDDPDAYMEMPRP